MQMRLLQHRPETGWSSPLPVELDSARTLVLVFAAPRYARRNEFWTALASAFPASHCLACSTGGQILGDQVCDESATVAILRFERVALHSVNVAIQAIEMSKRAGEKLGRALAPSHPRAVIVLADGLQVSGSALVEGVAETLPADTAIIGGLAADGEHFASTWTLVEGVPRTGWITAVGLSGPIEVGCGSRSGCQAFGAQRQVTRADGTILYELDGRPALALYKEYLGDLAAGLPGTALLIPLAVTVPGETGDGVVRTVRAVDEATQSLTFAADIPKGARARLMRSSHERLIEGATYAACAAAPLDPVPVFALAVSCVGRRLVLGERAEDETAATFEALPQGSLQAGFYAYGEIAPGDDARCRLHNQTMTVTTFREIVA